MKKTYCYYALITALGALPLSGEALAKEAHHPNLSGELVFELQNDWAHDSDDPDAEVNTLQGKIEADLSLSFTDHFSLDSFWVFEQLQDTDPGDDTYIENHGLYAQELKFVYTKDEYTVFAGKHNPAFGIAWDVAPGIYGPDFAEDYELTERIGFGGGYTLDTESLGSHTVSASTFFLDTSFLSGSLVTDRGDTDKSDGGLSNTEDFSSFSVALDSEDLFGVSGLNTHLGFSSQSEGDADTGLDRETGYVAGAHYTTPITESVDLELLGEWTHQDHVEGSQDDRTYLTGAIGFTLDDAWSAGVSYTSRDRDVNAGTDINDHMTQFYAGYSFDNGLALDAAYRFSEEADIDTEILGFMLSYTYAF